MIAIIIRSLQVRQVGQDAPEELESRDFRALLEARESKHYEEVQLEKKRKGLIPYGETRRIFYFILRSRFVKVNRVFHYP